MEWRVRKPRDRDWLHAVRPIPTIQALFIQYEYGPSHTGVHSMWLLAAEDRRSNTSSPRKVFVSFNSISHVDSATNLIPISFPCSRESVGSPERWHWFSLKMKSRMNRKQRQSIAPWKMILQKPLLLSILVVDLKRARCPGRYHPTTLFLVLSLLRRMGTPAFVETQRNGPCSWV